VDPSWVYFVSAAGSNDNRVFIPTKTNFTSSVHAAANELVLIHFSPGETFTISVNRNFPPNFRWLHHGAACDLESQGRPGCLLRAEVSNGLFEALFANP